MKTTMPDGDVWILVDKEVDSQHYGRSFRFDFSYIWSPELRNVVKDYTWQNYRTGNRSVNTLYNYATSHFRRFAKFAEERNIRTLRELTHNNVDDFLTYLHLEISPKTNKPLSPRSQKKYLDVLKTFIHWGQIYRPEDVPEKEIFIGSEYIGVNSNLRIEFIPDDVVNQINKALLTEENPLLKYGLIILQSTGMRRGDLLRLRVDCIKPHLISGETIEWFDHKNKKEHPPMPVSMECVQAVKNLIKETEDIRNLAKEEDKYKLFIYNDIYRKKGISSPSDVTFGLWLKAFIKRNNIRGNDGELFDIQSHQFRRTLATNMLSEGVDIGIIQDVLGHNSPTTTKRFYADVKDKMRAEVFRNIGIIGNIKEVNATNFENESEYEWFISNKDTAACLCDGYCTKPIVNGKVCERLLKRQKCYSCSRYITTPEYLEAHKQHLFNLEQQVAAGTIYGEHYAEHFLPTIEVLKVIIERLEELQSEKV